jgi:acyl-coenzyme A synthetase/AMP-(fatty) acid ligase
MVGYWGDAESTAQVLKPGPYPGQQVLYTGDLFRKDEEGFLYFVGRKDDTIKSRGERISPREIENCLCSLEGVAECLVIGIPDEILGQAIMAFIRCQGDQILSEKQVLGHCRQNLEDFMVPQYIRFLPAFPKTSSGKIDKQALKALALEKG